MHVVHKFGPCRNSVKFFGRMPKIRMDNAKMLGLISTKRGESLQHNVHYAQRAYCLLVTTSLNIALYLAHCVQGQLESLSLSRTKSPEKGDTLYLGKRKVQAKGFYSGLTTVPKKLSDDELTKIVILLKGGDVSVRNKLIEHHLGLTIQIVGRYVSYFPTKADDLMSVASVALVEAVNKFPTGHDNITGYIVNTIHGKLSDFLKEEDHVVQISSHGRKQALYKAKKEGTMAQLGKEINIDFLIANYSDNNYKHNTNISKSLGLICLSKISYTVEDLLEYNEIIEKCQFTRFEQIVYDRLMDGAKETDIAREMHYSKQRINQIKIDVVKKLKRHLLSFDDKVTGIVKVLERYWK